MHRWGLRIRSPAFDSTSACSRHPRKQSSSISRGTRALTHDATPSAILCASVASMPSVRSGSVEIHYEVQGAAEAPALLLLHSLGVDLGMWEPQMPYFLRHHRIIRYDVRGHGRSGLGAAECSIEILAQDAMAV